MPEIASSYPNKMCFICPHTDNHGIIYDAHACFIFASYSRMAASWLMVWMIPWLQLYLLIWGEEKRQSCILFLGHFHL